MIQKTNFLTTSLMILTFLCTPFEGQSCYLGLAGAEAEHIAPPLTTTIQELGKLLPEDTPLYRIINSPESVPQDERSMDLLDTFLEKLQHLPMDLIIRLNTELTGESTLVDAVLLANELSNQTHFRDSKKLPAAPDAS